jgi:hypothetical protein
MRSAASLIAASLVATAATKQSYLDCRALRCSNHSAMICLCVACNIFPMRVLSSVAAPGIEATLEPRLVRGFTQRGAIVDEQIYEVGIDLVVDTDAIAPIVQHLLAVPALVQGLTH